MQVTETLKDGLKRGYTITVTAAELDVKVQEKLVEAQPEVEMKGFRKGKVPMAMLRKQFGPRIMGDAMQEAIDGAMKSHFEASGDRPAMQPDVKMTDGENWKEGQDVVVEMAYEALPEIPELDAGKVTLERLIVKAEDTAVNEALANLAESAQNFEDRKKGSKAKDGDQVVIDFKGSVDGEAFEGGAGEDYPLVLGSNSFIPGFEAQLVGAKAGDEVKVDVSFPAEYGAAHLAGKAAVFDCTVKAVKAPKPAEIDDELAKKFGAEDLAGLKGQISERLEAEYAGAARAVMKRSLLDQLDGMVKFELPPSLVEAEAGQIAHQLWHEENPEVHDHNHDNIETT
ncbi:trigger factor, partial [Pseudorhodobacter sp.]|uniref:trigger factor n=1 Tax=Pseudorhodobacter sp. TaxID=1934400 RepID=UPI00264986EB